MITTIAITAGATLLIVWMGWLTWKLTRPTKATPINIPMVGQLKDDPPLQAGEWIKQPDINRTAGETLAVPAPKPVWQGKLKPKPKPPLESLLTDKEKHLMKSGKKSKVTRADLENAVVLYESGNTAQESMISVGVTYEVGLRQLYRYTDLTDRWKKVSFGRMRRGYGNKSKSPPKKDLEAVVELYESGENARSALESIGCKHQSTRNYLYQHPELSARWFMETAKRHAPSLRTQPESTLPTRPRFGIKVRALRKRKRWVQDKLGKKCGMAGSTIGRIERGLPVTSHYMVTVAEFFGLEPLDFPDDFSRTVLKNRRRKPDLDIPPTSRI